MSLSPRARTTLRWTGIVFGVLVAAILLTLALVDWNSLEGPIERFASEKSGRVVRIGNLDVDVWTWTPKVTVERLTLGNPPWEAAKPMAQIEKLHVQLKLLPLLKGDVILPRVELIHPNVYLHRDLQGRANWTFESKRPTNAPAGPPPDLPTVRDFLIQGGNITIRDDILEAEGRWDVQAHERSTREGSRGVPHSGQGHAERKAVRHARARWAAGESRSGQALSLRHVDRGGRYPRRCEGPGAQAFRPRAFHAERECERQRSRGRLLPHAARATEHAALQDRCAHRAQRFEGARRRIWPAPWARAISRASSPSTCPASARRSPATSCRSNSASRTSRRHSAASRNPARPRRPRRSHAKPSKKGAQRIDRHPEALPERVSGLGRQVCRVEAPPVEERGRQRALDVRGEAGGLHGVLGERRERLHVEHEVRRSPLDPLRHHPRAREGVIARVDLDHGELGRVELQPFCRARHALRVESMALHQGRVRPPGGPGEGVADAGGHIRARREGRGARETLLLRPGVESPLKATAAGRAGLLRAYREQPKVSLRRWKRSPGDTATGAHCLSRRSALPSCAYAPARSPRSARRIPGLPDRPRDPLGERLSGDRDCRRPWPGSVRAPWRRTSRGGDLPGGGEDRAGGRAAGRAGGWRGPGRAVQIGAAFVDERARTFGTSPRGGGARPRGCLPSPDAMEPALERAGAASIRGSGRGTCQPGMAFQAAMSTFWSTSSQSRVGRRTR